MARNKGTKRQVSVVLRDMSDSGSMERALRELKRKLKYYGFYKILDYFF